MSTSLIPHGPLVLMTGASGRVGRMVRPGLAERGWAPQCLDRDAAGGPFTSLPLGGHVS